MWEGFKDEEIGIRLWLKQQSIAGTIPDTLACKNEPNFPSPNCRLNLTLYDNANAVVGTNFGVDAPTGEFMGVTSALPYVLLAATGEVDDSAVLLEYAGQECGSNDQAHECDFAGYEDGNRDGDCEFDCWCEVI
ncbi:MAG: hypothetical protein Q9197_001393 [Variospora fuerteventurae]